MLKLAHLSDPHLGPLPDPKLIQLFSKRILGYLNWRTHRAKSMGGSALDQLIADLKAHQPDHIAVTGDLVNIALPLEIIGARQWLDEIGPPNRVSVVPGNHDAYVPGALKKAVEAWRPYMTADAGTGSEDPKETTFPYVRRRGDVAIIGVSTARATGPWFATGRVGSTQARELRRILTELGEQGLFRVVLIHHPPFKKATHWHKRLSDASRVRAVLKWAGAELVLHGHTHVDSRAEIEGPAGPIPVIGVPSATNAPGGKKPAARYNLFAISRKGNGWSCDFTERGFSEAGEPIGELFRTELKVPGQNA
ncbi:metallophosphoesterase family protein [Roseibium aggregatum]|uniref:Metallophosphoesterase n=1 Tax=Roseibium aggregatum TaxID=187304 RepID=A0A926NXS2_9HYPH|nr:metallophosphoesterase [Roseibium aggregatum]MBD1547259.1 metallophosphoesterase [Roseibium aggregatum]